jgi:deoxyadenosine/deoxycytidine kinase
MNVILIKLKNHILNKVLKTYIEMYTSYYVSSCICKNFRASSRAEVDFHLQELDFKKNNSSIHSNFSVISS